MASDCIRTDRLAAAGCMAAQALQEVAAVAVGF